MNMALAGGRAGMINSGQGVSSGPNRQATVTPLNKIDSTFQQRTQGSVFSGTPSAGLYSQVGNFGAYSHKNSLRPPKQVNVQPSSGAVFNGTFGSLTSQAAKNGMLSIPHLHQERNQSQDHTKTSDQMLEEANNLTMKDMWAAA